MKMDPAMLSRGVNEGFSGGEKKRNEILQMLVLEPKLMVLDETDSGLDIDALKIVSERHQPDALPESRSACSSPITSACSTMCSPDYVHVLAGGRIVKSGGPDLARELEEKGYGWIQQAA